jgi:hypothetical protein
MKAALLLCFLCAVPALARVTVQEYRIRGGHLGILDPASGKVEFVALGQGSSPYRYK